MDRDDRGKRKERKGRTESRSQKYKEREEDCSTNRRSAGLNPACVAGRQLWVYLLFWVTGGEKKKKKKRDFPDGFQSPLIPKIVSGAI